MSVWLRYYANRMTLMQSLGMMELDEEGRWVDRPLQEFLPRSGRKTSVITGTAPGDSHDYWRLTQPGGETLPVTIPESLEPELEPGIAGTVTGTEP